MRRWLIAFLFAGSCFGQACFLQLSTVAAPVTSVNFNNLNPQCSSWTLMYSEQGFTAVSVQLESAPDNAGVPGAFVAFAGTVISGLNPSTIINTGNQGTIKFYGYEPWVRINFVSKTGTGTLNVIAMGFSPAPSDVEPVVGASPAGGTPVGDPVLIAGQDAVPLVHVVRTDTGGNLQGVGPTAQGSPPTTAPVLGGQVDGADNIIVPTYCTSSAAISLSGSGLTQIVALSAAKLIRICNISLSFVSAVDFQLEQGTGANCGGGTAAVTGVYKSILTIALDFTQGTLNTAASQALCANLGTAVVGGGVVNFGQY